MGKGVDGGWIIIQVDYIDNFETKALDTIRDLAEEAERIDIAVA